VGGAAAVIIVAIGIAALFVASKGPFADKSAPVFGALIPITFAGCGAAHDEFADFAGRDLAPLFVEDSQLIAGYRFAGRAVAHVVQAIGQKGLKHFGRADTVERVHAACRAPALAERARQRLTGGDAQPEP